MISLISIITLAAGIILVCFGHGTTGVGCLLVGSFMSGFEVERMECDLLRQQLKWAQSERDFLNRLYIDAVAGRTPGKVVEVDDGYWSDFYQKGTPSPEAPCASVDSDTPSDVG